MKNIKIISPSLHGILDYSVNITLIFALDFVCSTLKDE
jgi:hypothetical protein